MLTSSILFMWLLMGFISEGPDTFPTAAIIMDGSDPIAPLTLSSDGMDPV